MSARRYVATKLNGTNVMLDIQQMKVAPFPPEMPMADLQRRWGKTTKLRPEKFSWYKLTAEV